MTAIPKLHVVLNPRMSARNAAKYFRLPMAEQFRFLREQKFPKEAPQFFRQPYYSIAIWGIREYLERGDQALVDIRAKIQRISDASQRMHVNRVVQSFVTSEHAKRGLSPITNRRSVAYARSVELRVSPDLVATEGGKVRYIYFNSKKEEVAPETARLTLELAWWILDEEGVEDVAPEQIEFIDLFADRSYRGKKIRKKTLKDLAENSRLIESLWPSLDLND